MFQLHLNRNYKFDRRRLQILLRHPRLKRFLKATFDYALTLPALLLLTPLLLTIALLIRLESPGPVLHRRRVLGMHGREFFAYKFRTVFIDGNERLLQNREQWVALLRGARYVRDPRVTRIGAFLRRTGMDELPRLLNILTRDMSLVGPRVLTRQDLMQHGRNSIDKVTSVLPGLTGLWQLSINDVQEAASERLQRDLDYVNNWSLWLDFKIILSTFTLVWGAHTAGRNL